MTEQFIIRGRPMVGLVGLVGRSSGWLCGPAPRYQQEMHMHVHMHMHTHVHAHHTHMRNATRYVDQGRPGVAERVPSRSTE